MTVEAPFVTQDGRVRVVGYNDMREMLEPLAARFSEAHPGIVFELDLRGTRHGPEALADGTSAFAPMGAVFTPNQLAAYRRRQPRDPACFRVAHASPDPRALSGPLGVVVHAGNPVGRLSLEQLGRIFTGTVDTWGDLGLTGPWRDQALNLYGMHEGTALRHEFSSIVIGARQMALRMHTFAQSADVVAAVVSDPGGIGFAAANRVTPGARLVPLRGSRLGRAVLPTAAALRHGSYPLDRFLYICTTVPMPAVAREFLRLMLSEEGQRAVAGAPQRYVPLSARQLAAERRRLDE